MPQFHRGALAHEWRPDHVYAIRYATRPTALRGEHFYGHDECADASMPIDYFVWLITGPGAAILVDAGFTPEVARLRPGREHLGSPLDGVERLGYPVDSILSVIVTHGHYDHTGYLSRMPGARIHLQERELAFWTGRHAHRETYRSIVHEDDIVGLVRSNFEGRVDLYDGDASIANGVTAHLVGGHTAGTQVVRVELGDGRVVVLASDASHFYANIDEERPFSIAHTVPAMFDAFDTLHSLARTSDARPGLIVPGHDPLVCERFEPAFPRDLEFSERIWEVV